MERDAYAIWWYNRLQRPEVDLGQFDNSYIRDLRTQLAEAGRRLWVLDVTSDLGIPSFVAISHWMQNAQENIEFGSGAHFDARIALLRALTELNQFLSIGLMGGGTGEKSSLDGTTPLRLQDHPYLTPSGNPAVQPSFGSKFGRLDTREQVTACVRARQASGPRLPRPRSDAPRHRGPGRQSDRSGIAAFLSPLRARPALRCSGKARIARPAAAGKRAQSDSPPHLRVIRLARSRNKAEGDGLRRNCFRPAQRSRHARSASRTEKSSPASTAIRSAWERSAPAPRIARRTCAPACRSPRSRPDGANIDKEIDLLVRRLARRGLLEYRLRRLAQRRGPGRHRTAGCRLLAANAAARQRRRSRPVAVRVYAAARQRDGAGIAARRRVVQDLRSEDRGRPGHAVHAATNQTAASAGRISRGSSFSPCSSIAKSFSRSTLPATAAFDRPRATTISFFGTFTIFCSTRAARKAGTPIRWAEFIPMRASCLRCRRCGPAGPERKSICASFAAAPAEAVSPVAKLLRERHSTRSFDDQRPITLAELSRFLDSTARVLSKWKSRVDLGDAGPLVAYAVRPYPSAGASYELELYLAVDKCEGLARGFYHYDAGGHALVPIGVRTQELEALLTGARFAMGAPAAPQIVITIAARFGRISWKYSSIAYALILKDVGVLTSDVLPDGDRHGARRMCDREHQYRSVREDDRDRIPRRGPGRSICARPRREIGDFRLTVFPGSSPGFTRTIAGRARRKDRALRRARNIRSLCGSRFPSSANMAP